MTILDSGLNFLGNIYIYNFPVIKFHASATLWLTL